MSNSQQDRAALFSIAAHEAVGQIRKYTGEQYWHHPREVAAMVRTIENCTSDMICAAYLHDVLEDTQVTEVTLRNVFGNDITDLVVWLTDVSRPEDGNRETRKALDRAHIAQAPAEAQNIKCCDLCSNTMSIMQHDKNFAKVYLKEKAELLVVMTKADRVIWQKAWDICQSGIKQLEEEALQAALGTMVD
jgi:guanosine-3',5'-bis(diphosphate) 3'-pyrophosphohydrolase